MAKILSIPEITDDLSRAAQSGGLMPFVGAGASVLAGCPNWSNFSDATVRFFANKGQITLSECEQLKGLNNKIKLAIARSMATDHATAIAFERILHPKDPMDDDMAKGRELYGYLSKLSRTFVTTNYDRWLDNEYPTTGIVVPAGASSQGKGIITPRKSLYRPEDFVAANLKPNTVIHLHGSIEDPASMVLTTSDYIRHYSNDRGGNENKVLSFLEHLFSAKNILFVGYGLEELEILEYVIQKSRSDDAGAARPKRHFLLTGYFSHEEVLASAMEKYYSDFGIQLLPFLRDENDWEQLANVLKDYAQRLPSNPPLQAERLEEMAALLK